ncbi:MAG: LysM peptidoglycan-binding domain-containing protein [Prevotellaceae bacterium]|jgi:LysM repeat protein|nr:LysM peptidoglycan-binding domain-containing protein [Prevotellaceae bacterium]
MKQAIIILFFLCLLFPLWGQQEPVQPIPVETSSEQVRIGGQLYYIHLVLKKQTLYSISRHYGVSIDELKKHNPQLAEGLKEGDRLKIPVVSGHVFPSYTQPTTAQHTESPRPAPVSETQTVTPAPVANEAQPQHQPQPDTATTQAPGLSGLTRCASLENEHRDCSVQAYDPETMTYRVALLLPFDIIPALSATLADTLKELTIERLHASDNFIEFYAGALLAVEDMRQKGFSLFLSIYDVKHLDSILIRDQLRYADLVIGPVYTAMQNNTTSLEKFLLYARERQLRVVSPLDPKVESLLPGNPMLFQVPPPLCAQQERLLENISKKTDRVLLIYEDGENETALVNDYKTLLEAKTDSLVIFHYKVEKGLAVRDTLLTMLHPDKQNHIVVASNNEALVSDFTSNLSYIQSILKYPITLYGQARWRNFENVDLSFFHHMNLHLSVPFYVDYQYENVRQFVKRYRMQFNREPSQYAFQGHDVFFYFLNALRTYGKEFAPCLSDMRLDLLQGNYIFRRAAPGGGYLNTGSCLVHYTPELVVNRK